LQKAGFEIVRQGKHVVMSDGRRSMTRHALPVTTGNALLAAMAADEHRSTPPTSLKLLDRIRDTIRTRHYRAR
jgi:hypothetical protein